MDQNQAAWENLAWEAARRGDLRGVKVALAQGADVNAEIDGECENTMLVISLDYKHYDVVRFLLEHGANPNLTNTENGGFPLLYARTARLIDLLVAHGADVNRQHGDGDTPLMARVVQRDIESVRALLRHGASPSIRDDRDETALTKAQRGREIVRINGWMEDMDELQAAEAVIELLQAVEAAGSYKRYLREPVIQLLALRYLSLAGRASAPANLLRLFGAPPVRNAGKARTRACRAASTPLPDEVFKLILGFWNERV